MGDKGTKLADWCFNTVVLLLIATWCRWAIQDQFDIVFDWWFAAGMALALRQIIYSSVRFAIDK